MPAVFPNNLNSFSNIPLPPSTNRSNFSFPSDLVANGRNFTTCINFVAYEQISTIFPGGYISGPQSSLSNVAIPAGSVVLPIPKKINDVQTVVWAEETLASVGAAAATTLAGLGLLGRGLLGRIGGGLVNAANLVADGASAFGAAYGLALNPGLYMAFKHPAYKEHTLQWTLAPNNEEESNIIANTIIYLKRAMLPAKSYGVLYTYPNIALISLQPNSFFTLEFKPCALISVQVDYTGGGSPSFFKNGAPTVVNLALQFKEIELWTKEDFGG